MTRSQVYSEQRDAWNTRFILELFIYSAITVLITEKTAAKQILQQSANRGKVEGIVAKRFKGGPADYFIQWQNYSSVKARWKPAKQIPRRLRQEIHDYSIWRPVPVSSSVDPSKYLFKQSKNVCPNRNSWYTRITMTWRKFLDFFSVINFFKKGK